MMAAFPGILAGALLLAAPAFAQTAPAAAPVPDGTVEVKGSATRTALPDRAVFNIRVTGNAVTESESYRKMQETSNRILDLLKQEGFTTAQVRLTDYSINPQYSYNDGKQKRTGFLSTQSLELKFPLDKARIVRTFSRLAGEEREGVEVNYGTEASDSLTRAIENELMVAALQDASAKARLLAEAARCRIRGVAYIRYNVQSSRAPIPMMQTFSLRKAAAEAPAPSTDFSIGEQRFTEEVDAAYFLDGK